MKNKINDGLKNDSTFNKMKKALGLNPTQEQIIKEEQKWQSDSDMFFGTEQRKPLLKALSDEERLITLPNLIKYLEKNTNDMVHLTAHQIINDFNLNKQRLGMKNNLNIPRLMKLTAYIRYMRLLKDKEKALVSGASGYFISEDSNVIRSCGNSLIQRCEAQMEAAIAMIETADDIDLKNKINKQNNDPFGFDFE